MSSSRTIPESTCLKNQSSAELIANPQPRLDLGNLFLSGFALLKLLANSLHARTLTRSSLTLSLGPSIAINTLTHSAALSFRRTIF
jgi:hypothetical protein